MQIDPSTLLLSSCIQMGWGAQRAQLSLLSKSIVFWFSFTTIHIETSTETCITNQTQGNFTLDRPQTMPLNTYPCQTQVPQHKKEAGMEQILVLTLFIIQVGMYIYRSTIQTVFHKIQMSHHTCFSLMDSLIQLKMQGFSIIRGFSTIHWGAIGRWQDLSTIFARKWFRIMMSPIYIRL